MSTRFTLDGSDALEQHLAKVCDDVREGVKALIPAAKLEGLALAGGYGRGEGGVLRTAGSDEPYNDIEFFVFVRGSTFLNERRFKKKLHALGERLTPSAGVEVEFKVISADELRRAQTSMFYYDLVMGHRWLIGDDRLLEGTAHHRDASLIPLREATRLLFNRCSGLLFARERLQRSVFTPDDADFVARNIAKAQLALGDALLAAEGRYHWSCRERHQRLQADAALRRHHAIGVEFKLHPQRSTQNREDLATLHAEVAALAHSLFLEIEGRRLRTPFASICEYAHNGDNKCPEQPLWKNILQHLRMPHVPLGVPQPIERHPRESLLHALCLMLWDDLPVTSQRIQSYTTLWHRFN
ncbi:MAG: hypothetical protein IAE77_22635 [Prosthecobacter sp.]|jgi:hypothetical protein|uniref:hypothetical protein n=1 Tax=Prosthecobacter sp. TaxID=1965333 RepID=UPI001A01D083|nr:hypothetical protein [Prosthecobacter sp.]MBE2286270.1 hypothetical protein [Prosthecobacter sp.]